MLYCWDIIGTFFFAISGAFAARQKGMDLWGSFLMALVTGTGGGILRNVLIGVTPPVVFEDPAYIGVSALAMLCVVWFPHFLDFTKRIVSVMDAIGLGVFVCIGTHIAMDKGLVWWAAASMGVITGTFGGVIRDMWRAEVPLIFRKEIYATAALGGGFLLILLEEIMGVSKAISIPIVTVVVAAVRVLAIRYAINHSE